MCVLLCHETVVKRNNRSRFFSFLCLQQVTSMLSTDPSTLNTKFCKPHVLNLHVLVSLDSWGSSGSFVVWDPPLPMNLHLHRFPFRHLHVALQLVRCHLQLGQICVQSFRWTHERSVILVSRLLRIVHNIGFCGLHFFGQMEIEEVVFDRCRLA